MAPTKSLCNTAVAALLVWAAGTALAQPTVVTTPGSNARSVAPPPSAPSAGESARYVESCQQGIEQGVLNPGCQGPIYANEIGRLKEDALRSQNPGLLMLLGDAYTSPRAGLSDISQAYRWYLLAAVRGDPRAMQRLSELYRDGRGVPRDSVKALGYARLTHRLALPGSASARGAATTISKLGSEMAAEEIALAERFADELERGVSRRGGTGAPLMPRSFVPEQPAEVPSDNTSRKPLSGLPGIGAARAGAVETPSPGAPAPGLERGPQPAPPPSK